MTDASSDYRRDIDGLRAIAVLAVILYHLGISWVPGGYVGVDVFFVISGYLITGIIKKDIEAERFNIVRFYERRIRRIMPALLFVMLLTLTGAWYFTTPAEYSSTALSALSSLTFVSNFYFWRGSGYFEQDALRPLLHTWSLSVEEQFYIIFPIALFLAMRFRRLLVPGISAVFIISLAAATYGVFRSPSFTFFLIPTRAWELMMGVVLALGLIPETPDRRRAEGMALLGMALILGPIFLYGEHTPFPGLAALPPCLGTAMLIHSRHSAATWMARLLSIRLMVFVGLLSYSLYLVHYPLVVFAKRLSPYGLDATATLVILVITFGVSYCSWRWIERPFRDSRRFSRASIFKSAAAASLATGGAAMVVVLTGGLPQRFTLTELRSLAAATDFSPEGRACLNRAIDAAMASSECQLGSGRGVEAKIRTIDFLLVGDSHASAISPAFATLGGRGVLLSFNACPPLLGLTSPTLSSFDQERCSNRNAQWIERARAADVRTVYLAAYWSAHLHNVDDNSDSAESRFIHSLELTLVALEGRKVIILLDVPHGKRSLPVDQVFAQRLGYAPPALQSGSADRAAMLIRRASRGRADIIDLSAPFCDTTGRCNQDVRGVPILTDNNHVTATVARRILTPIIADKKGAVEQ